MNGVDNCMNWYHVLFDYNSVQFIGISAYVHAFGQSINSKKENDGQGNNNYLNCPWTKRLVAD